MKNIRCGTILKGHYVELRPLEVWHFDELDILGTDERIWTHIPTDMSSRDSRIRAFEMALNEREKGTQFPFVIYHLSTQQLIGSTRLMDIVPQHHKLEIGWTWLQPQAWGTAVNPECKLLLLQHCFEVLGAGRVQLKTDENNRRSRKAIAKLGAQYEGIWRKDWIRDNGTVRNTAYFSILDTEWEQVKQQLKDRLNQYKHT